MNKLFFGLLILTLLGGGILGWLYYTVPQAVPEAPKTIEVHSKESTGEPAEEHKDEAHKQEDHKEEPLQSSEGGEHHSEAKSSGESENSKLTVSTEPVQALVFVDGQMKGQTPLEIELTSAAQKLKLEAAGYNAVEREIPAVSERETAKTLAWTITLRAAKGALHESPRKNLFESKTVNPQLQLGFWVQLKAIPQTNQESVDAELKSLEAASGQKPKVCKVDLAAMGVWHRFLVGPYKSKDQAGLALGKLHEKMKDTAAFVTGDQKCL